jgi:TetR/AcrR family transcriptional repressor of nem operon
MTFVIGCQTEFPMPWNKDHKQATRARIVEAASSAIRTRGAGGIGVAEIMEAAGLTHGGFYAHFASKDDLVSQAIALASEQSGARLGDAADSAPPGKKLQAVTDAYLGTHHFRNPERGCVIAALGSELARGDGPAHKTFRDSVRRRLAWLEELAIGRTRVQRRRQAAGTLAAMVGALIVARAMGDSDEGEKYLADVRRFLRDCLDCP